MVLTNENIVKEHLESIGKNVIKNGGWDFVYENCNGNLVFVEHKNNGWGELTQEQELRMKLIKKHCPDIKFEIHRLMGTEKFFTAEGLEIQKGIIDKVNDICSTIKLDYDYYIDDKLIKNVKSEIKLIGREVLSTEVKNYG